MWSDDTFEDELRLAFSMMDDPTPGAGYVERTVGRYRRWRLRRRLMVASPGVAAATGLGLALGLTGVGAPVAPGAGGPPGTRAHHPSEGGVVRVADYVFNLPAGFRLTAASTSTCLPDAVPATGAPPAEKGTPHAVRIYPTSPYGTTQIATAANASGGCVRLAVTASFTPTPATPNPYFMLTASTPAVRQVTVGGDSAWLRTGALPTPKPVYLLTVEVPQGGGAMRDLVVSSIGLSTRELLAVISQGLS